MGECIFLGILSILSGIYFVQTLGYSVVIGDTSGGAGFFPRIVCIGVIVLAAIRVVQIVRQKEIQHFRMVEMFQGVTGMFSLSTLFLVIVMPYLGFVVSGFIYLSIVSGGLLKARTGSIGSSRGIMIREAAFLILLIGIYIFFTRILFVALPAGFLGAIW